MRALDNNIKIQVGFIQDYPLGYNTKIGMEHPIWDGQRLYVIESTANLEKGLQMINKT